MKTIELTDEEAFWLNGELSESEDKYSMFLANKPYREDYQRDLRLCKSIMEKL